MRILMAILFLAALGSAPEDEVKLQPARWRSVRQTVQKLAEQAGFRWAMPATVSRRAFVGTNEDRTLSADDVLREVSRQTGVTCETVNGVRLLHIPREERRKTLVAKIASGGRREKLAAISELGWLQDARAWPELAKVALGDDVELALAAAQALRRLEGEKALDWRLHGVSDNDPDIGDLAKPVPPWEAPLALAFAGVVAAEAVERLAGSLYIPLREAAARLSAALGEKDRTLAERLAGDPSPIVKAAALRAVQAWARPERSSTRGPEKGAWDATPPPDLKAAAEVLGQAKDHDTVWRLQGRRVGYMGTPEAIRTLLEYGKSGQKWSSMAVIPLAEWCGGADGVAWLREAAGDKEHYTSKQGWGLWGLAAMQDGEDLAASLKSLLETGRAHWPCPPEYTAAQGAGLHALPALLSRMKARGHWVCLALGYIGGPEAVDVLVANLGQEDAGVAVAAAKALGETAALAGAKALVDQLKHGDRLRLHWAVLGLGRIGGPDAARALTDLLVEEEKRKDRLVRKAAAEILKEIGPLTPETHELVARFEEEDRKLAPEYRPRSRKFDESFPVNTEVRFKEHEPKTYCSIGETRVVMDWANRLMIRYGGCTGCYSNECFAFDVGTGTWFPIRAADHFCCFFNEGRPNPG